jgi:hypothetical protein
MAPHAMQREWLISMAEFDNFFSLAYFCDQRRFELGLYIGKRKE